MDGPTASRTVVTTSPADCDFVVCPFTVVTDSREQAKFHFRNLKADFAQAGKPLAIRTVTAGLKTGDYSIQGFEDCIAVERKEFGDFYNCCGNDRPRFQKQLERLNELEFGAVVVEAGIGRILQGHPRSRLKPKSVFRSMLAWQQRLPGVHWWLLPTKRLAEVTTFRILERWWKDNVEKLQESDNSD